MRRLVWLIVVLVVLGAAQFAYWRVATDRLADGYAAWVAQMRAQGATVASGAPVAGGWPLAATLTVPDLAVRGAPLVPEMAAALGWTAARVVLRVALADPTLLQVLPEGARSLRLGDGPALPYTAGEEEIDIPLVPGAAAGAAAGAESIDLLARDMRLGTGGDAVGVGLLKGHVEAAVTQAGHGSAARPFATFLLAAEAVALPATVTPAVTAALGPHISSLSVEGTLVGTGAQGGDAKAGEAKAGDAKTGDAKAGGAPPAGSPAGGAPSGMAAGAAAWRDGGGVLDIRRLALGWGPLGLSLTAALRLDGDLQPAGRGDARVVGLGQTLDALAASHAIGAQTALAVKAVLALLVAPARAGAPAGAAGEAGGGAVDLPLSLEDRVLSVQRIPLIRLPALVWP